MDSEGDEAATCRRVDRRRRDRGVARLRAQAASPRRRPRDDDEVPARVGRLADLGGEVYHAPADRASDWSTIGRNYPIATGDNLWVAEGGRAEIDFGGGQIRLGGSTNVHVARLDDRTIALFVAQGRAIVRLRVLDPGEVARIDTPNTQIALTRPGLYRVDVSPDRQRTTLVVREGEATMPTQGGMQQVLPGQTALADGLDATYVDVQQRHRDRRLRHVEREPRPPLRAQPLGDLRVAADGRLRGPRRSRALGERRDLRRRVVSDAGRAGLGAVPQRLLDHRRRLRLDLGRLRAVGLRAVPLRPLGAPRRPLGLVPGRLRRAPALGAGDGRLGRRLGLGNWARASARRCTAGCRSPGASRSGPGGAAAGTAAGIDYNRPYSVHIDERNVVRRPTQYVNSNRPGGITAVGSATLAGAEAGARQPRERDRSRRRRRMPVLMSAPSVPRDGASHVPLVKPGTSNTPPPASTIYATTRGNAISRPAFPAPSHRPRRRIRHRLRTASPRDGRAGLGEARQRDDRRRRPSTRDYRASPSPGRARRRRRACRRRRATSAPVQRETAQTVRAAAATSAPAPRRTPRRRNRRTRRPCSAGPRRPTRRRRNVRRRRTPAPVQSAPSQQGLPMPPARVAPQPAPAVQHAPPTRAAVQHAPPPPQPHRGRRDRGAQGDGGRGGQGDSGRGGNDGGGGGGNPGAGNKPMTR